ncbi:DUF2550 family protein [Dietzia aurantiaca]|uniref:DUF2550 family protein n=1 Tax=Dietzia aurantiaca TaxID=983873 RepID=A0ABV9PSY8_9ACTN
MTAPIEVVLGVVVLLILAPVVAAVVYRLVFIRHNSTSVLTRQTGEDAWTYGAVRYTDADVAFYRLFSIRFTPDVRLDRRTLVLGRRRHPTGSELDVVEAGEMIVPFSGRDRRDQLVEGDICLGPSALTGLMAWVEACSTDQIRPRRRRR